MLVVRKLMTFFKFFVPDIRYKKKFSYAQPMKVKFIIFDRFPACALGYVLFLTNKFQSISSVGARHFDLKKRYVYLYLSFLWNWIYNVSVFPFVVKWMWSLFNKICWKFFMVFVSDKLLNYLFRKHLIFPFRSFEKLWIEFAFLSFC